MNNKKVARRDKLQWNKELGQQLKREMLARGMNNKKFAEFLNIDPVQVSQMINGYDSRGLTEVQAEILERQWGISKWWFFGIGGRTPEESQKLELEEFETSRAYLRNLGITIEPAAYFWVCNAFDLKNGLDVMEKYLTDTAKTLSKAVLKTDSRSIQLQLKTVPDFSTEIGVVTNLKLPQSTVPTKNASNITRKIERTFTNEHGVIDYMPIGYIKRMHAIYINGVYQAAYTLEDLSDIFFNVDQVARAAATAYIETINKRRPKSLRYDLISEHEAET